MKRRKKRVLLEYKCAKAFYRKTTPMAHSPPLLGLLGCITLLAQLDHSASFRIAAHDGGASPLLPCFAAYAPVLSPGRTLIAKQVGCARAGMRRLVAAPPGRLRWFSFSRLLAWPWGLSLWRASRSKACV
jgi:hypothetical protein